jgi:hypothetical protein
LGEVLVKRSRLADPLHPRVSVYVPRLGHLTPEELAGMAHLLLLELEDLAEAG